MNTQHTPGPWNVSNHADNNDMVIRSNDGDIICNIDCDNVRDFMKDPVSESQANARLIAAAPDMLSVLIEAVEHTRAYDTNPALVELFKRVISNATTQNT